MLNILTRCKWCETRNAPAELLSALHIKIQLQPFACNWAQSLNLRRARTGAINQVRIITCCVPFYLAKAAARHPSWILRMSLCSGTSLAPFIAAGYSYVRSFLFVMHRLETTEIFYCLEIKEAATTSLIAHGEWEQTINERWGFYKKIITDISSVFAAIVYI